MPRVREILRFACELLKGVEGAYKFCSSGNWKERRVGEDRRDSQELQATWHVVGPIDGVDGVVWWLVR